MPSLTAEQHVTQNVETIATLYARADQSVGHHQRAIERLTSVLGRPSALYSIIVVAASWITFNLRLGLPRPPDPPPFFWLQGVVALCALLMTTMVLTTQNRQARQAERRAELNLQVNLRAEQKVTKVVALLEELRRDLPVVPDREDPVADAMTRAVDPHAVISALEETFDASDSDPPSEPQSTETPPR